MKRIFVDTSGWANLAYASEPYHHLATEIHGSAVRNRQKLITTNYVVGSVADQRLEGLTSKDYRSY